MILPALSTPIRVLKDRAFLVGPLTGLQSSNLDFISSIPKSTNYILTIHSLVMNIIANVVVLLVVLYSTEKILGI